MSEDKKNKIKEYQREWRINNKSDKYDLKRREWAKSRYHNLSEEDNIKKREYSKARYRMLVNMLSIS